MTQEINTHSFESLVDQAVEALSTGKLVIFPTDTLFGLAADALDTQAVLNIYRLKRRSRSKGLPLMIPSMDDLKNVAVNVSPYAKKLMEMYWPGPLTIILEKSSEIPHLVTGNKKTVAIRIPNHNKALQILSKYKKPLAVTSANISRVEGADDYDTVCKVFRDEVELIIPGRLKHHQPSTIIDCSGDIVRIIRQGVISIDI